MTTGIVTVLADVATALADVGGALQRRESWMAGVGGTVVREIAKAVVVGPVNSDVSALEALCWQPVASTAVAARIAAAMRLRVPTCAPSQPEDQ